MGLGKALRLVSITFLYIWFLCNGHVFSMLSEGYCDFGVGLREDSLKWNIAGPQRKPNIASELDWERVRIVDASLEGGALLSLSWPLHFSASCGKIFDGRITDKDFFGEDRSGLFLKSVSKASRGEVFDLSIDVGRTFFCSKGIQITPVAGYCLSEQHLKEFDGFTEFNLIDPEDVGKIRGLNSGYNAKWYGPFMGVNADVPLFGGCLGLGFDYYYPSYSARGKANLRTDLIGDYIHKSRGFGKEFFAKYQGVFREKFLFEFKLKWGKFWTKRGDESETVETADQGRVPLKVDLNRVEWKSKSLSAHLIKKF